MAFLRDELGRQISQGSVSGNFLRPQLGKAVLQLSMGHGGSYLLGSLCLAQQAPGNKPFGRERVYKPCKYGLLIMGPS